MEMRQLREWKCANLGNLVEITHQLFYILTRKLK